MSISDIRHCRIYVEMNTYDVLCVTYDVVCQHTTSYVTYDVARTMSYVYTLYIARTTSYVRCSTRCRMSHVRCRTCMTYDIVRDVRHRRWQESRCPRTTIISTNHFGSTGSLRTSNGWLLLLGHLLPGLPTQSRRHHVPSLHRCHGHRATLVTSLGSGRHGSHGNHLLLPRQDCLPTDGCSSQIALNTIEIIIIPNQ